MSVRKLGKKVGVVHDPRSLRLASFMITFPPRPQSTELAKDVPVPMFGNDSYGDCTCASMGHRIIMQEHRSRQHEPVEVTTDDVLEVYTAVSGFDPNTGDNDNGAYLIDVLREMRNNGMGREADGTRHTIGAYVLVDHTNHEHVKQACWMFGGGYVGVNLPIDADSQISNDEVWEPTTGSGGRPGSWGGHAMWMDGYSAARVGFRTWGQRQKATWPWWDKYVDEFWVLISEDFLTSKGNSPQGFDLARLQEALSALS